MEHILSDVKVNVIDHAGNYVLSVTHKVKREVIVAVCVGLCVYL